MKWQMTTSLMVKVALLATIGFVLMQFELRLPIFPRFLALDISDVPGLVGAVFLGPVAGVFISLLKNLLDLLLTGSSSGGIGQFANFVIGASLVVPIGIIYRKYSTLPGYLAGGAVGLTSMVIVACLMNYFILLPLYSRLFMPMETILEMANAVNSSVTNVRGLILLAIVPFNLLKGGITIFLGYLVCRALMKSHLLKTDIATRRA